MNFDRMRALLLDQAIRGELFPQLVGEGVVAQIGTSLGERQKFCVHGIIGARQTGASNEHEHQTQFS